MEYLMTCLGVIGAVGLGVFIGIFIGMARMEKAIKEGAVGDLRIDRSEPTEPPKPCLEIYKGNSIDSISRKKFIILRILNENYLPRD